MFKPVCAIIFLCLGNTSRMHDCKKTALSLVFLVSTFDMVMAVLRKKQTKKFNCAMVLKIRPSVVTGYNFGCGC